MVAVGDHGPRDTPSFRNRTFNELLYDERCMGQSWDGDSSFTTSAVISYLGEDESVLKYFSGVRNKVYTGNCDHNDLAFTLQ